jgi:hypothetical protein
MRPEYAGLGGLLAACLLLAGCTEANDTLHEVGGVRATVYRHLLRVEPSQVEMPGDRLAPSTDCGKAAAPSGMFDPCRPDPDQPALDAYGQPLLRPSGGAERPRLPPVKPRARATATARPAAVIPHAKPGRAAPAKPKAKPARKPAGKPKR